MNPFERIKSLVTKKLWSEAPSRATYDLLGLYHTNPRLDGARIIAQKCASTELYLYDRADFRKNKNKAEVIETHELYDLLDDPCPTFRELSGWTVRYFVFACYTLVGEAYLLKVRKDNGKIAGLLPIAPSWVVKTPTAGAEYWEIYPFGTMGGNSIVVPFNDVICFKDINLNDPYGRGKGTSETIGDEIQTDELASKYAKNLFYNDATPSAIIYAPSGNKDTADQIKQSWLQKMAGFHHAKEPMVLTGEGSKFEKISQSPTELDFTNSRKYLRDTTNEHYHIPPEIFGILQNSNRSTIDSAYYLLNKNVLSDYLRMYERNMNSQLLWEDYDPDRKLIFRHENTIDEDIDEKLKIVNDGLSRGVLTVNDWRVAMGYERDERSGDVYLRNLGQVEVPFEHQEIELPETEETLTDESEQGSEEIELPESNEESEQEETPPDEQERQLSEAEFKELSELYEKKYKVLKTDTDKERRKSIWKVFDARARSIEDPFTKAMRKAFTKQNELLDKAIAKACDEGKDVGTVVENFFGKEANEALKHSLAGAFMNGLTVGAEHGASILGKKSAKEISDEVRRLFNLWIDTYGLELCADMNKTTKDKLRKLLAESVEAGDSLAVRKKKMIEATDGMFAEDKKWRAELIARTESCTTMNAGAVELYRAEGLQYKEWISVQDDRTRDAHLIMDGTVVPITDKFEVPATSQSEGAFMEFAGDPTAPASQVCNCRCTVAPYIQ